MKTALLLCILVLLLSFDLQAQQKMLQAINMRSNKRKIIPANINLRVRLKDGKVVKGRYIVNSDSTILIDGQQITLDQVASLKRSELPPKLVAAYFILSGGLSVAGSIALRNSHAFLQPLWPAVMAIGGVYLTGGYFTYRQKKFSAARGWQLRVVVWSYSE